MAEEKQRVINGRNLENSNNAMKENETWLVPCWHYTHTFYVGNGRYSLEGRLLQHQPHYSQWSKVLHSTYVGSPLNSNHSSSDSKQRNVRLWEESPHLYILLFKSFSMNTLLGYQSRVSTIRRQVRGAMEIALFIQNLQEERAEVALFIFTKQTDANFLSSNKRFNIDLLPVPTLYLILAWSLAFKKGSAKLTERLKKEWC